MNHCPLCSTPVNSSAIVDAFNAPADWQFWGDEGARWIVCRSATHVHFRVRLRGRMQHRLAVIRDAAAKQIAAERAAAQENQSRMNTQVSPLPVATEQEDWLL